MRTVSVADPPGGMSAVRMMPFGPSIASAWVTVPWLWTLMAIVPGLATAGVDGVILNSVSVSDTRADGRPVRVADAVVVGLGDAVVVVLGAVGVEDMLEVLEELEELDDPEEPHAAIAAAASTAPSAAMIDLELRISCPSEDWWPAP